MSPLPSLLIGREAHLGPRTWEGHLTISKCSQLRLSHKRQFDSSSQTGGIMWVDLDPSESRYLLAAAADATIAVYDTHALEAHGRPTKRLKPTCFISRNHPGVHQYLVSSVAWYPHDTGMFVSGAYDNTVKLWDTNTLEVACTWPLPAKVSCVALSSVQAADHCLVAAACLDPALRLCDPRTGAFTHTLVGHRHPIWSVSWSRRSQHELVSGDAYGQVCVWDVRRFGPQHVLDQYSTQRPQPAATTQVSLPVADDSIQHHRSGHLPPAGPAASVDLAIGKPRAASTPAELAVAVSSAWDVVHTQLPQRSRSSLPAPGAPSGAAAGGSITGKRTRGGDYLPISSSGRRDSHPLTELFQPTSSATARRQSSAHHVVSPQDRQQSSHSAVSPQQQPPGGAPPREPFHRLPLSASAPGHRPGRVGDAIGGRAPSSRHREGAGGVGGDVSVGGAGSGLVDEHVRAHQGSVTCVLPSPDGLGWLTAGTDSRLHLWDAMLWHRRIVGFTDTFNRAIRGRRLAMTQDGRVVFHPCGSSIQVFDVQTGRLLADLEQGHSESINACAWSGVLSHLYTAANDSCIKVWEVCDRDEDNVREEEGEHSEDRQAEDDQARPPPPSGPRTTGYSKGSSSSAQGKASLGRAMPNKR